MVCIAHFYFVNISCFLGFTRNTLYEGEPFNGYKYQWVDWLGKTWKEGREGCRKKGGDLIVHGMREFRSRRQAPKFL